MDSLKSQTSTATPAEPGVFLKLDNYIISPNSVRALGTNPLPANLKLMCGDFDLERTIQLIEQLPQPPRRTGRAPTGPEYSAYLLTRSFLRNAIQVLEATGNAIIIIDTDPYFNVITTHMGLIAADFWFSAYSPASQASQFAVLRSIEFMFDPSSGLKRFVSDEQNNHPFPWYDNRGNPLTVPSLAVGLPHLLIANMVNPYRLSGNQSYTTPQQLQRQTIAIMGNNVNTMTAFPRRDSVFL